MSYLLSLRHFRRNEDYIMAIVNQYPNVVHIPIQPPISQGDVLARNIRYAGRSLMANQWQPTKVNFSKFVQVWDDVVVSPTVQPGVVVCGPEATLRAMAPVATPLIDTPQQVVPQIDLKDPAGDLLQAIIVLHHYRYLSEPSRVVFSDDIEPFVKGYDVAVERDGNTYTIL